MRADSHVGMSKGGRKDQRGLWRRDGVHQRTEGASEERAYGGNLIWESIRSQEEWCYAGQQSLQLLKNSAKSL